MTNRLIPLSLVVMCLAACDLTRHEKKNFTCEFDTEVNGGGQKGRALLSVKNSIDGDDLATPIQALGYVWLYSDLAASKTPEANSPLHVQEQVDRFNLVPFKIEEMELVGQNHIGYHRSDKICQDVKYVVSRMDLALGCKRDAPVEALRNLPRIKNYCVLEEVSLEEFERFEDAYWQEQDFWLTKQNELRENDQLEEQLTKQRQLEDRKL